MNEDTIGPALLDWLRGPGLEIAFLIMAVGFAVRVREILVRGRKKNLAPPKGSATRQGILTVFTRFWPHTSLFRRAPVLHLGGWIFHLGFFVVLLFASAHIRVFEDYVTVPWPRIAGEIITPVAIASLAALMAVLASRILHPLRRRVSGIGDYVAWTLTALPFVTGLASSLDIVDAPVMLKTLHVASVLALMVALPFTKLSHVATAFWARYYTGSLQGWKGAKS